MSELDEDWKRVLDEARRRAAASGRGDVADYLRLREANDERRATGIGWLFEIFTALVGHVVRQGAGVSAERAENHRFTTGAATMTGERIVFRYGVRALTVEAGYPRAPGDGFVQGGGLARAAVSHFGDKRLNAELLLVGAGDELNWYTLAEGVRGERFTEQGARSHVEKLLAAV